ncbi:WYL domain-containing protein [Phorcysia thermohydrogeniphila]|uniref:WYL domain-containing protein n=1 Tax=Phorcysia thermohydrogeniphila TaxID=936138 RepID=A0A4R1G3G3_9BACT|nr:WYL domain-containing protein [Phorcysia thermohydrogeniphila]TCK02487.1 WYL domain-containing protein [Phorcysia thermohydrogeniphila]
MRWEVIRFKLAVEILNFLLQKGDFVSTPEIQKHLFSLGLLESVSPAGKDRRKLNRLLSFLESTGYIESERADLRGRKPQRWRVNEKALPYLVSISDEEMVSLLTFATFVPETYRNLPIFSPFLELLCRLSKRLDGSKKELIEDSFVYETQFLEKFVSFDQEVLIQVHRAIIENRALRVKYKGSEVFKIFPLKIFVYNGVLYVGALKEDKEDKSYRTYYLAGLKVLEELNETLSKFYRKQFRNITFGMKDEEPFLFGMRVALKGGMDYFSEPQVFSTQFFFKKEKESYLIYLVGFLGSRFTSRFLVEEVLEIIPPSQDMIAMAKERKLKEKYSNLSFSLEENRKKFSLFVEELRYFLKQRKRALEKLEKEGI